MNIVCGTDFSERAQQATELAAHLAKRLGGKLTLVHACEPWLPTFPPELANVGYQLDVGRRDILKKQLAQAAQALRGSGVVVEERLVDDYPDRAVLAAAKETKADLIVVGSHGLRAAERWLLGSVSEKILEGADRPVLVLPAEPRGMRAWLDKNERLRLTVGIDATRASDAAVQWVKNWRMQVPTDLNFVSVYWPPAEEMRLGIHPRQHLAPDPNILAAIEHDLRERVGTLPGTGAVQFVVKPTWGRIGDALAQVVTEGTDLIVVGHHHRRGLARLAEGSVSRDLLHAAQLPVLFVPPDAAPAETTRRVQLSHLLACTDFSPTANRAIPYAYALLRGTGGTIDLLYVTSKKAEREGSAKTDLERKLLALVPPEAGRLGIVTHAQVVGSEMVPQAIAQAAERVGANAIVVGSRGQGGLARAVLGSVARELLDTSPRPVLVVPPERE